MQMQYSHARTRGLCVVICCLDARCGCTWTAIVFLTGLQERVGHCNTEFARAYAMATCMQQLHYLGRDLECPYYPAVQDH